MSDISVSFIGAGNLASHLAPALDNAGIVVREVYARKKEAAKALCARLYQAHIKSDLDFRNSYAKVFFIAVRDESIEEVARNIMLPPDAIVVHTSASQPLGILDDCESDNIGVFYPLQTFTRDKAQDLKDIPILIESMDAGIIGVLKTIGSSFSRNVLITSGVNRRAIHLAAVFANNFTNHMFKIARDIAEAHNTDFKILSPLIRETVRKMLEIGPDNSQTGPARRRDFNTLDKHLEMLRDNDELSEIYRLISQHIADTYHEDDED